MITSIIEHSLSMYTRPLSALIFVFILAACGRDSDVVEPRVDDFERFTLAFATGPCMFEQDCSSSIEVSADGMLLYDAFGEYPVVVHEATATPAQLEEIIPVLMDPELIALLDLPDAPCVPPTDIAETMRLVEAGVTHENSTTICDNPPIAAARDAMNALVDMHFPP